ncbi:uncharacterized protein [Amphiura filiformis]|uniref:uncharacterized protein isoform X2 n=1 Tax=Amphiura filiformis TaxID=82378 RepID=UPI003B213F76
MFFVIFLSVCCSLTVSEEVSCVTGALGMGDGKITKAQITASSYHTSNRGTTFNPWRARPSSSRYWRPHEDTLDMLQDSWIQVDFLETVIITGIETQGSHNKDFQRWIRKLQVQTGTSVNTLTYIADVSGNPQIFVANTNYNQFVMVEFPEPISTRYLRIVPTECVHRCGLSFEVFGCRLVNECVEFRNTCDTNAECKDEDNGYRCTCKPGFEGNGLECKDINECASSPCQNGATCRDGVGSYICTCIEGYMGDMCETNINECLSSPCLNDGSCEDGTDSYRCHCFGGYTGDNCQTDIDECAMPMPACLNGGICENRAGSYICVCTAGYTGVMCQTDIDECGSSPCLNGGTCEDRIDSYSCRCATGYSGDRCQTGDTSIPSETETQSQSNPTTLSPNTQNYEDLQMKNDNLTAGITTGAVIGGIFLMIMVVLIIACLFKRRKKQIASSTNPRLDFDGPYDITLQGTNVTLTNPVPNENTTNSKQSFALHPNSYDDTDDVYHDIQDKECLYVNVAVNRESQGNSSSAAQEGWNDNTIYANSADNGEVNQEPVLYANVDKSKINAGIDNNTESGWMDNSIYATSDDDSRPLHNATTEGWADNTIYGD